MGRGGTLILSYHPPKKLPDVIAIDEFKGNAGKEKYQAIITDPQNKLALDILPDRKTSHLTAYMKQWARTERAQVKYFVSDMWKPCADLASTYLKSAVPLVDKYHDIRQIIWAFERVRKTIQKKYGKENRLIFKRSKRLLTMRKAKPSPEQLEQVEYLRYLSDDLISAYFLKEKFYDMIDCKDRNQAEELMYQWILLAQASRLTDHNKCADTLQNWVKPIFNTFRYPFINGFTEGCNNKIKVLKRNAYGYRNFARFRNRILHIFHHKHFAIEKVAA